MFHLVHNIEAGAGAATIASRLEDSIVAGVLPTGRHLPTIRDLAAELAVAPATVAAAYRTLKQRGLVDARGRRGTVVTAVASSPTPSASAVPPNTRDLASGNPDPALLPPLRPALAAIDPGHKLYGGPAKLARLVELINADFAADGLAGGIAIVGGALDGIERVLQVRLRPGDRVVVEDPSWPRIADLIRSLGLRVAPVRIDERGLVPAQLAAALADGAQAVIVTPRGHNPTGAAIDVQRGLELSEIIGAHQDVMVIEDDFVAAVAGAPYVPLHQRTARWVVIRSLSKVLGPDLRVSPMIGDGVTISRVEGRQLLGAGWVSHLLQQTAASLWADPATRTLLAQAAASYAARRAALVAALGRHGIAAFGGSGLGVWVPVTEEVAMVQHLLDRGWAVSPGERYRSAAPPGIRITITDLDPAEAEQLAAAIAAATAATAATAQAPATYSA